MAPDLYSPCPCGSGKKLKWCCQPIYGQLEKIFRMDEDGQHEAALKLMDQLVAEHPTNPEVWGRKSQLLFLNDQVDAADEMLNEALRLNPNYAFAFLMRGCFRQHEGELTGALLLFRKAVELYDPEAKDILADIYARIAGCELRLNHPVAAHFAFQISLQFRANAELQEEFDNLFGAASQLPSAAREAHSLKPLPSSATAEARQHWNTATAEVKSGRLSEALTACEKLVETNPTSAAAHYDLGLIRAWRGDNAKAIEAFDQYLRLEPDEALAAGAWKLALVLSLGRGLENQADYVQHTLIYQVRDAKVFFDVLQKLREENRLVNVQVSEDQNALSGVLLEKAGLGLVTTTGSPSGPAKLGAYLLLVGGMLRFWNTSQPAIDQLRQELLARGGVGLGEPRQQRVQAGFSDVLTDALAFPLGATSQEAAIAETREHIRKYFEEQWICKPVPSLGGVAPQDAVASSGLRKKLIGLVDFIEDCAHLVADTYDFKRLREKLGLGSAVQVAAATASASASAAADIDIVSMSPTELAALPADKLNPVQLDQAFRTAQKVGSPELASQFARVLVGHASKEAAANQFQAFSHLIAQSLSTGKTDEALELVDAGEKSDCENNEGRRRNDFELRRGQILAKLGDSEQARAVFERLLDRAPAELRYCGSATEAMLGAKQGKTALQFAERGLAKAREKNDRDSEQYFMELAAASRKQGG
jgi:tetratricopeptide (TPR) repeat protein